MLQPCSGCRRPALSHPGDRGSVGPHRFNRSWPHVPRIACVRTRERYSSVTPRLAAARVTVLAAAPCSPPHGEGPPSRGQVGGSVVSTVGTAFPGGLRSGDGAHTPRPCPLPAGTRLTSAARSTRCGGNAGWTGPPPTPSSRRTGRPSRTPSGEAQRLGTHAGCFSLFSFTALFFEKANSLDKLTNKKTMRQTPKRPLSLSE